MLLYSGPLSLFSAKTRIALAEKGLEYELVQVGWNRKDRYIPHHPEVVRLNPNRKVPVLIDGDITVYDSTQIAEYLEERYPRPALFPQGIAERALCRRQEADADDLWFPLVWEMIETRFYPNPGDAEIESRASEAQRGLGELYAKLEGDLAGRDFVCEVFSVADIATAVFVFAASTLGAGPPETAPNVQAWLDRVQSRPSVAQVMAELTEAAASAMAA